MTKRKRPLRERALEKRGFVRVQDACPTPGGVIPAVYLKITGYRAGKREGKARGEGK